MTTRIEKTAIIEVGAFIGENCYIGHYTIIRPGVVIGDYSEVRAHCFIAAKAQIGKGTNIYQFSNICRDTVIEDNVFIGPGVIMTNTKKIAFGRDYNDICQAPIIEYGARIGGGCIICPNVRIGSNSSIGAGSVITKNTEPGYLYHGSPAKKIRLISQEEII